MDKAFFKELVDIQSISGDEGRIQTRVEKELEPIGTAERDAIGNRLWTIGNGQKKVLITAHIDEVGFIVTYINEKGYLYFQPVGGVYKNIAVGQEIVIMSKKGPVNGIIGAQQSEGPVRSYKELWIDIGCGSKGAEHVKTMVEVGDRVCFNVNCHELADSMMLARGTDNKAGVYVLVKALLEYIKEPNANITLYAVTAVQEEVGSRGIQPIVTKIKPDIGIILDTTHATDLPESEKEVEGETQIGYGPTIYRGPNIDETLFRTAVDIAHKEGIAIQLHADAKESSTDADQVQRYGQGNALVMMTPVRYMHLPAQVFSKRDVDDLVKLTVALLKSL